MHILPGTLLILAVTCSLSIGRTVSAQSLTAECQQQLLVLASALFDYRTMKVELAEKREEFDALDDKKAAGTLSQDEAATWTSLRQEIYLEEQNLATSRKRFEAIGSNAHSVCAE